MAEVDAVTDVTIMVVTVATVAATAVVAGVATAVIGTVVVVIDCKSAAAKVVAVVDEPDTAAVVVVVTVSIVATAVFANCTPSSFCDGGGAFGLLDVTGCTGCFLRGRGDDLTTGGGRLVAAAGRVAALVAAGLTTAILAGGCGFFEILGDLTGNGDLGGTGFRGVGGPDSNFLRGDDLAVDVAGTGGGLLVITDRSFVDTDSLCLVMGRRRLAAIRGSDDCRLSGSDDGLVARDRPFSGVLNP